MKTHTRVAEAQAQSERAPCSAPHGAVVASARPCPVCGTPLQGRQQACSARCRAAKSRRARIPVKAQELRDLRALVVATLDRLWEAKNSLDNILTRS